VTGGADDGARYADEGSFTFVTTAGHTLSAWITVSPHHDGDVTVAQAPRRG
jgi:hypothetical protein